MIVSDTSPLIAFAKVDALSLLKSLFNEVHIPTAVHRELLAKTGPEAPRLDEATKDFLIVTTCPAPTLEAAVITQGIGEGEQEAIILAHSLSKLLLIDERTGRQAARRLKVEITGVVGVLIQAKSLGLIAKVSPVLEEMRRNGYWLSDGLIALATKLDGEDPQGIG